MRMRQLFLLLFFASLSASTAEAATLYCNANVFTAAVGQQVTFTVTNGNPPFTWSGNEFTTQTTQVRTLPLTFISAGTKTINVRSGNDTGTCSVQVTGGTTPPPTTPPPTATFGVNQPGTVTLGNSVTITVLTLSSTLFNKPLAVQVTVNGSAVAPTWVTPPPTNMPVSGVATMTLLPQVTGNYLVRVIIEGISQTVSFTVVYNAPPPPPSPVLCVPASQSGTVGQPLLFNATGGTGAYTWSAPGAVTASGTGVVFSASYTTSGQKTVSVTDGRTTATCSVTVQLAPSSASCRVMTQNPAVGQTVVFELDNAGTGPWTWSSPGLFANQVTTDPRWSYAFSSPAQYVVNVVGPGMSAVCPVSVQPVSQAPLTCTVSRTTVSARESVQYMAGGGSGAYEWFLMGSSSRIATGQTLVTSFIDLGTVAMTVRSGSEIKACPLVVVAPALPRVKVNALTTADFRATSRLVPGNLMTLWGEGMAVFTQAALSFPFPVTLGGAKVSIDGVDVPLHFVSENQINFQVPNNVFVGNHTLTVRVTQSNGVVLVSDPLQVGAEFMNPGLLKDSAGVPHILVWPSNRQNNSGNRFVASGGFGFGTAYATGMWPFVSAPSAGYPLSAGLAPLDPAVQRWLVVENVGRWELDYAGLAPGWAGGLIQLNFRFLLGSAALQPGRTAPYTAWFEFAKDGAVYRTQTFQLWP